MTPPERYLDELARGLQGRVVDAELLTEVEAHLADLVEEGVAAGLSRAEAERAAVARFGPVATLLVRFPPLQEPRWRRVLVVVAVLAVGLGLGGVVQWAAGATGGRGALLDASVAARVGLAALGLCVLEARWLLDPCTPVRRGVLELARLPLVVAAVVLATAAAVPAAVAGGSASALAAATSTSAAGVTVLAMWAQLRSRHDPGRLAVAV